MAKQIPTCTSDSQTLPALMNAVLNSSALDSGAVAVGLLPRHRCCPGSCYEVESKENTHDLKELQDNKPSFQDGVESQEGGAKSPENKHSLEGLWQDNNRELFVVETVKGKPGYLFGTMIGKNYFGGPPKQPQFWFKTGDDGMPKELQGKFYLGPTQGFKACELLFLIYLFVFFFLLCAEFC